MAIGNQVRKRYLSSFNNLAAKKIIQSQSGKRMNRRSFHRDATNACGDVIFMKHAFFLQRSPLESSVDPRNRFAIRGSSSVRRRLESSRVLSSGAIGGVDTSTAL